MYKEIEKKFLLRENKTDFFTEEFSDIYSSFDELKEEVWRNGVEIIQGYFSKPDCSALDLAESLGFENDFVPVEARLRKEGEDLSLTLKGEGSIERNEFEVGISEFLFNEYWSATFGRRLNKIRLKKSYKSHEIEIDFYTDRDLVVAEVEFSSLDEANVFPLLGKDITEDSKYKNKNLTK